MSVPKPVLQDAITEPAGAIPGTHSGEIEHTRQALGWRAWLLTAVLFLVPLVAYWPATFHDYGLRDDYSNLREAHEEPGTVIKFCASHARPIYGWLLQSSYGQTDSVQDLRWMRLGASLLLGGISLVMFRGLRSLGWSYNASLCFAVLLALVPSAQVIAGWAVGWPYAVTALLAIAGFFTVDGALHAGGTATRGRALGQWLLALALMVVCALIYQPSALFYVVPLAAGLIAQRRRAPAESLRWLAWHLSFVTLALVVAYCIMTALYTSGVFVKSNRIAFEHHWGDKTAWFFDEAMPNALSLWVLNDNNHRDHGWYLACAALVGVLLIAGLVVEWRRHGRLRGLVWAAGLFGLPVFALSVSLVASVRSLTERWSITGRRLLATLVVAVAFFSAQHHVYALIAVPQGNEWSLILQGARHVRLDGPAPPRIFAIASSPADLSTQSIYHDEFGSLSSNSEWVPKEMFMRAMHDLHPDVVNLDSRYEFSQGYRLPPGERYDVIIDMHRLSRFHTDN